MLAMKVSRLRTGFTLVELVVVLSVMAILAVFAAPAGLNWWQRETVVVLADRFVSAIALAQAMSRSQRAWIHLGPLDAQQRWSSGWALYMTPSPQTQATPLEPDTEAILVHVSPPVMPQVQFTFTPSQRDVDTLSYAPVGYSRQRNGSQLYGTLTIRSGAHVRRVRINSAGRARICDPAKDAKTCGTGASANDD
ncbi:GspH/FimT family pseudopilin [Ralstonia wenshanensis]|uniref:GspH/FimT family pseudopilin n=1 Tax=Ralstonia wenshanensis TaxID=2842456 RepID=UPI0021B17A03|nr:GspH/FimT family pseudopilin [Ralstonia wenshanensis]MCT7307287.1 prepilin-type N-terminal cleavage/methylation domain-containing protein [Ralstonia wenshanensis]